MAGGRFGGPHSSIAYSQGGVDPDDIYNVSQHTGGNIMSYPYMFDQNPPEELQFADKIKMMNNQKFGGQSASEPSKQKKTIMAASGDPLSTILIQTFVEMM